jgi:hypothetical protein
MYQSIDSTNSEFITSRQLEDFFGDVCSLIVFFYGHEGIARFCDFVKMVTPLSTTLEEVELLMK